MVPQNWHRTVLRRDHTEPFTCQVSDWWHPRHTHTPTRLQAYCKKICQSGERIRPSWARLALHRRGRCGGTVQEVGGPQYHTGYDQWKAGKYPGQDRYANLHAFLCNQCSIRGFSNHQAASNRHLVALCKAFDALARADDEVAPHMRKPLSSLVKLAKTKADEMPLVESEAVPAPAPTQQAPALVADLAIARQVEVEMAADDNAERSAEALEAAIANERQRARGYTTTPVRNSNDCLYPSLHKHEVYAYVEAKLMAQYAEPVGLDAPAEPFPRASEMVHVPEDIQGDSRVMGMLRESHAWAKPTPEGLACRACFDASKRGVFVGRCLPWNEVKSRFTSRAKEYTEATRQKHTEKWAQWLAREDSVRRHGTAGEIRSTAHQRAWVNSKVKQLQNTEMLCRLLHDVQYCCSNNEALTTTLASLRVRDSYTSPEVKSFNATYHNLTSNTIYDEVVGLMASHAMAEVKHKIERSPFVSIITDETQDVTRQSQFCILIRVIDPTTFDTNELFWRMTPLNTSQTATNITDFLIQQLDDLGDGFWNKMLAFASDSCNTMGGSRKGVQLQVKVRKAPYSFWAACRAHALNLVAMHTAKDHPVIRASYDLVSSTFALLYRGAGNGTGKLRCFRECMSALERIDGFGFWRERDLCSVGDTRWCSHERCAQSLTDCLKGVVMCINKLDHEKAVALRAVYQESSTLVGLFLMREVMHCLGAFSRCIQHASLCFGDLPRIATHYACKIGKLLERPDLSPTYASCWILINDAPAFLPSHHGGVRGTVSRAVRKALPPYPEGGDRGADG